MPEAKKTAKRKTTRKKSAAATAGGSARRATRKTKTKAKAKSKAMASAVARRARSGGIDERPHRVIELMMDGRLDPVEMAGELGMSLEEMAEAGTDSRSVRVLLKLAGLADLRALIVVSRFRMEAAARLVQMATEGDATELARKACVDLLRLDLDARDAREADGDAGGAVGRDERAGADDDRAAATTAMSDEAIRSALAELGEAMGG